MGTTDPGPGTPPQDQAQTPPQPQPEPVASGGGLDDNLASALAYIPIVAIVWLIIEPYNRNRTVRFHSFQSIFFAVACVAIWIVELILTAILSVIPVLGTIVGVLLGLGVSLALFIVWIFLIYKAFKEEKFLLPVIGPLAEKQA